ncbi:MAG: NUDIX domain-containing protein [Rhodobacterales bacterium]|nr:NUDIX domain-containing protein [Rhodobacterales bacterium]MDX5500154.1 NUDIX domain-containing protein [Rhodobacterales bacterium]
MSDENQPIRDAATVILARDGKEGPEVLMGQRGAKAAFMPNKFVFPGGGVDAEDRTVPLATPLSPVCTRRLGEFPQPGALPGLTAETLAATAIRELWEETGLALARPAPWPGEPTADWTEMAARGLMPDASPLQYVFRAITPPGRTRRFDARFFLADVTGVAGDPDDFSFAQDELAHLQWVPLRRARGFDLPFITEVVIAEVARQMERGGEIESVPFFDNSGPIPAFRRIA